MTQSAHADRFVIDHLPPADQWPTLILDRPELAYPAQMNAAGDLLARALAASGPDGVAMLCGEARRTWRELDEMSGRMAAVLVEDMGLIPGNRVLLHGPNAPWAVAAWFAILKAGGVVVATMPLLRAGELAVVIDKAQIGLALVDVSLTAAVDEAQGVSPVLKQVLDSGALTAAARGKAPLSPVQTAADDPALIAFTSGTTGKPKGCVHGHRDILAMADTFSRHVLKPQAGDVFCGTPPIAFTFGLGGLVVFPTAVGATMSFPAAPGFDGLVEAIQRHRVTTVFTAPTGYRALLPARDGADLSSLKTCVSAGEALPAATSDAWHAATGIRIIDGIGATEMIHIFISASGDDIRPGATGKPVPGYEARLLDEAGQPLDGAATGRLAVRGPTGCRYLSDPRQADYVSDGWNLTGDIYRRDEDGYYWFVARADDMIVSSGYNIGAPEVENALLAHPAVAEAAVVGAPDAERGQVVSAHLVLNPGHAPSDALIAGLQTFVKARIAPYKYPRRIAFVDALPKTQTGKLQRFRLKES